MDFNDDDRTPINFEKTRRTVNKNHLPILGCIIALVVLIVLLFIFIFLDATEDVDSTKVEVALSYSDVKITNDPSTCVASSEAIEDGSKVKISYKKSSEKFFNGKVTDLVQDDGSLREVSDNEKIPGVDLVIEGITNNIYAYIEYASGTEDNDGVKYTAEQSKDGKVTVSLNAYDINHINVYIYSNDKECPKLLKNFDTKLPMYNKISENSKCDSLEGKESSYCSEYSYTRYDESVLDNLGASKKNPIKINIPAVVVLFILFIGGAVVLYIKFN